MHRRSSNGFTLGELLVVVAIIGVLVAVSIPIFSGQREKAKIATCAANRRSLLSAVMNERISNEQAEDTVKVSNAAKTLGVTADGYYISGLCPDNGIISVEFYDDGEVMIYCSVHTTDMERFPQSITSTIIAGLDSITRGSTTLRGYLSSKTTNHIDSEAGSNTPGATGSWVDLIKNKMRSEGSPLLYQGWAINYNNHQYSVAVTKDGESSLTSAKNGDYISVVKYVYDDKGNKISSTSGTMKVILEKNTYNRLDITTPGSFKAS